MGVVLKGLVIVVSGASGVGKTTLIDKVVKNDHRFTCCVSHTSRDKRNDEIDGQSYYFVEREYFKKETKEKRFLEVNKLFGNYYGTSFCEIQRIHSQGKIPILNIDVDGFVNIKKADLRYISIFIKAPSEFVLKQRLKQRNTESDLVIAKRLKRSQYENSYSDQFDFQIINDDLKDAYYSFIRIVKNNI
jgi:guanylate kinase